MQLKYGVIISWFPGTENIVRSKKSFFSDGLDDPLEDNALISQQLEQLSTIGRCEYDKTCALLVRLFDESAQRYQELVSSGTQGAEMTVQQGTTRIL